jgi:hypothetical protein
VRDVGVGVAAEDPALELKNFRKRTSSCASVGTKSGPPYGLLDDSTG